MSALKLQKKLAEEIDALHGARLKSVDLSAFIVDVVDVIAESLNIDRVSIWRAKDGFDQIECLILLDRNSGIMREPVILHADEYPVYFAAISRGAVIAADAMQDNRTCEFREIYLLPNQIHALLDVPIVINGRIWGIICAEHLHKMRDWQEQEKVFIEQAAEQLALKLDDL